MKIAPLRDRLTFEVRKIVVDEIGNESSVWNTVFQRWCSSRPLTLTENEGSVSKLLYNKRRLGDGQSSGYAGRGG